MPRIEGTKKYLLVKRSEIINQLEQEGYSQADIAVIFNIDKSGVNRIINFLSVKKTKGAISRKAKNINQ